ncbi:MAG: hypothetical protein K2X82_19700 [Gemmataceae bacterium]|nr:hypothetical protein [Gemmataceae bacterium]
MWALIWRDIALDLMTDVYVDLGPEDRDRLAREVEALNARLRSDPHGVGESRDGGNRITCVFRLAVFFHVDKVARVVTVNTVRPYGR